MGLDFWQIRPGENRLYFVFALLIAFNITTSIPFPSIATVLYDNEPEILDDMNDTVADVLDEHRKKFGGVLQKVMHTCSKMILACVWQGKMVPCTELFSVRRTDDGFCCSFNTLRMSEQL